MEDNLNMNNQNQHEQYVEFMIDADVYKTTVNKMYTLRKPYEAPDARKVTSFMPGTIQEVFVQPGQEVTPATRLCILEAMKMKNVIFTTITGKVKDINVSPGQLVPKNFVLIELE